MCQNGVLTPKPRCSHAGIQLIDSFVIFTHESSKHYVCGRKYTCEFYGYSHIPCLWTNCLYEFSYYCGHVGFNNATSEIYIDAEVDSCCVLQCNDD
uniref:Uncharacterized protein n=1 Tax=Octopus bimaculoides TaxID=37653 RepID=A0A0L8G1T8_OCTBM